MNKILNGIWDYTPRFGGKSKIIREWKTINNQIIKTNLKIENCLIMINHYVQKYEILGLGKF
jgi:hypothetical protein